MIRLAFGGSLRPSGSRANVRLDSWHSQPARGVSRAIGNEERAVIAINNRGSARCDGLTERRVRQRFHDGSDRLGNLQ
jgi:hypothetical protein